MTLELADLSSINCYGTDYHCDVDFKAKVDMPVDNTIDRLMCSGLDIRRVPCYWRSCQRTGQSRYRRSLRILVRYDGVPRQEDGQEERLIRSRKSEGSSQERAARVRTGRARVPEVLPFTENLDTADWSRLWSKLTEAIKAADMHGATAAKTAVEDRQRELAKRRESSGGGAPEPRFFMHVDGDRWMPRIGVDG